MTTPSFATRPTPRAIITPLLVGVNVLAFVATVLAGVSLIDPSGEDLLRWGADFGPRTLNDEPWRLLTATFLHFGIIHLALNMWCLWALGTLAEPLFGGAAFLLLYLLSGLGGSVLSMLVHPMVVSAGASGAVFGVAGGLITFLWLRGEGLTAPRLKNALGSVVGFVGYNLVYSLTRPDVDIAGHVGGLAVGLVLGTMFQRKSADDEARLTLPSLAAALAMALLIGYGAHAARRLHGSVAVLGRADRDVAAGAYDRAIAELDSALDRDPSAVEARALLARAYGGAKRWQEALGQLDTAITREPNDPALFFQRGNAHLELGHTDRAIADFATVIRLAPRVAAAHYNRGVAYARRGDADSARMEFERALASGDDALRRDAQAALTRLAPASPPWQQARRPGVPAPGMDAPDSQALAGLRARLAQARDSFDQGRYAAATIALRTVERGARSLATQFPDNIDVRHLVVDSRRWLTRVRDACLAEQIVAARHGVTGPTCP